MFDRPLIKGVSFRAVYTLAKSSDDASAFLITPADKNFPQDSQNVADECRKKRHILHMDDLPGLIDAGRSSKTDMHMANFLKPLFPLPVVIPWWAFVTLPAVAVGVGIISSVVALRRAVGVDPSLAFAG